jgi:hypothetical protein
LLGSIAELQPLEPLSTQVQQAAPLHISIVPNVKCGSSCCSFKR